MEAPVTTVPKRAKALERSVRSKGVELIPTIRTQDLHIYPIRVHTYTHADMP